MLLDTPSAVSGEIAGTESSPNLPVTPLLDVLVGNAFLERLLFGRGPSDHAGVVATLQFGR